MLCVWELELNVLGYLKCFWTNQMTETCNGIVAEIIFRILVNVIEWYFVRRENKIPYF